MEIKTHQQTNLNIAEVLSDQLIIKTAEDGLDLLGDLYYQNVDVILLHEKNLSPDFFDLKTGMAGELLQKFSNYRMRAFIIGDFTKFTSKSTRDFIVESNRTGHIQFVATTTEALNKLSK